MANYDVFGDLVVVKFSRETKMAEKKKWASDFLNRFKNIKSVLEKSDKFKGRLRVQSTKHILGEKTKEVLCKENGCVFRFNLDSCYYSPRLSSERLDVANMVKKGEEILVMCGGVGPFAIVIAKLGKAKKVISVELGRECSRYALENVKKNKVDVEVIQGDVRKQVPKLKNKFDRIVMARPNLKDTFLDVAFNKIKKNGIIQYYGFCSEEELVNVKDLMNSEAEKAKKKIKILEFKKAGEIGPFMFRYRVDFRVLN
ncbi:class I SAM-dependent methyltransferase family protein [Candidatus Pacearchaeota archaeon CG10_big_fil_rev_8_21_14_0_10_31_24]|nr:MAG: class I SAM-dependent methyltransferase family protein [Candidatus Pacearchaeota archaeon CG10_big_fil_rev_8_21_14_0_10_31_24]